MGYIFRLPNIDATNDSLKIEQIRRYLYQTVKEIEWAINTLDGSTPASVESKEVDGNSIFSVIKPLIIRSADIINAYYDIMKPRFDDAYAKKTDVDNLLEWIKVDNLANPKKFDIGRMENGTFVSYISINSNGKAVVDATLKHKSVDGSILSFASSCFEGVTYIKTSDETTDLPDDFTDCVGTVQKVGTKILISITDFTSGSTATNIYTDEWSGWI